MVESFEEAAALDDAVLRALLDSERPEQRVWAIWALALRTGDGAAIGRRATAEPDPGVRRTLAVMLAAHGDTELLLALARHDPQPSVRHSALQLVTRLAAGGGVPVELVLEAETADPETRIAVLGGIGDGAPAPLVALATRLFERGEGEVGLEAFEALLRIGTPATLGLARARFDHTADTDPLCDRWTRVRGVESLADALADASVRIRAHALVRMRRPPWSAVERLIGSDLPLLRHVLGRPGFTIPAHALARTILAGQVAGFAEMLTFQLGTAHGAHALLASLRSAIDADQPDVAALFRTARRVAEALELADGARVLDELAALHPVEQLFGLEHAVASWVASTAPRDLLPLVPELRAVCERRLAALPPQLPERTRQHLLAIDPNLVPPWNEAAVLRALLDALSRC